MNADLRSSHGGDPKEYYDANGYVVIEKKLLSGRKWMVC